MVTFVQITQPELSTVRTKDEGHFLSLKMCFLVELHTWKNKYSLFASLTILAVLVSQIRIQGLEGLPNL